MSDKFQSYASGLNSPASDVFPITPSDDTDLPNGSRAFVTDGSGDVSIETVDGNTRVIPSSIILAGVPFVCRFTRVNQTSTTANVIWGYI